MANASFDLPAGAWEDGSTVSGTDLRRGHLLSMAANGSGLIVRGGVRAARSNTLAVSLPGGMFVRIAPGHGVVPAASGEGGYAVSLPSQQDLPVTAANGTNPRIDTVGLEVVPGSPTTWRVRLLDGTPAASPSAPTYAVAGGFFLPLADVRTNALATSPVSVTDRRSYTAAAGGVIYAPGFRSLSGASQSAIMATLPLGTPIWDETNRALGVVGSAGWFDVAESAPGWGGRWVSTAATGIPSDTTERIYPLDPNPVAGTGLNASSSDVVAGRVQVPYAGMYTGSIRAGFPASSAGQRFAGLEVSGNTDTRYGRRDEPIASNSYNMDIPFTRYVPANGSLGVRVWQTSGAVVTPTVAIDVALVSRG